MDSRLIAALALLGGLATWGSWLFGRTLRTRARRGGERAFTSDATRRSALLQVDAALADSSHAATGSPAEMVKAWVHGRACVSCGATLVEPRFASHHVALLDPSGMTREWVDVAADRLPLALATSLPVCWNCHVAEKFRRMHPELVIDRDSSTRQKQDDE